MKVQFLDEAVINRETLSKIKDEVIQDIIYEGSTEIDNALHDDDLYYHLESLRDSSPDVFKKVQEEAGYEDFNNLIISIKNDYRSGYLRKVLEYALGKEYDKRMENLVMEYMKSDYIYRAIDSHLDFNDFMKEVETNGIGNCWAKLDENAKAYYGGNMTYSYVITGESSLKNVDIKTTMFLRMTADYEDEIRLLKNSPVKILGITKITYDKGGFRELDRKKYEVNKVVSVGSKYIY